MAETVGKKEMTSVEGKQEENLKWIKKEQIREIEREN